MHVDALQRGDIGRNARVVHHERAWLRRTRQQRTSRIALRLRSVARHFDAHAEDIEELRSRRAPCAAGAWRDRCMARRDLVC
jgi:hypothetical protein